MPTEGRVFAERFAPAGLFLLALFGAAPLAAQDDAPLSAIDWLSQSVAAPPQPAPPPVATEGVVPEDVSTSIIGGPSADAVGLLPPSVTGLPAALWGMGRSEDITARIREERTDTLPALRQLLLTVLLAESHPPADAGRGNQLLLARIDKLLDLGALDQARALLDVADPATDAELFRRSFDVDLLTGSEDDGCATMVENPELAPTFPARIFCLARSGDWNASALALRTGLSLGYVTPDEDALLSRFLDPDRFLPDPGRFRIGPLPFGRHAFHRHPPFAPERGQRFGRSGRARRQIARRSDPDQRLSCRDRLPLPDQGRRDNES